MNAAKCVGQWNSDVCAFRGESKMVLSAIDL